MDALLSKAFSDLTDSLLGVWTNFDWNKLEFVRTQEAILVAIILFSCIALAVLISRVTRKQVGRRGIVMPFTPHLAKTRFFSRLLKNLPMFFILLGGISFVLALADPVERFVTQDEIRTGRKMVLVIDNSSSMNGNLSGLERLIEVLRKDPNSSEESIREIEAMLRLLNERKKEARREYNAQYFDPECGPECGGGDPDYIADTRFDASIQAAEYFIKQRAEQEYEDIIGIVIFASEAFTAMPFTPDYVNLLTTLRLLSDPDVFTYFPGRGGTKIAYGIREALLLFGEFGFLDETAGNRILVFSDGEDSWVKYSIHGNFNPANSAEEVLFTLEDVIQDARNNNVPIDFLRTDPREYVRNDSLWSRVARETGGNYYRAHNAEAIINAIREIDKNAVGVIEHKKYRESVPKFEFFALIAFIFWSTALLLYSLFKFFRTFP